MPGELQAFERVLDRRQQDAKVNSSYNNRPLFGPPTHRLNAFRMTGYALKNLTPFERASIQM